MRYNIKDDQVVAIEVRDGVIQKRATWLTDLLYNGTIRLSSVQVLLCLEGVTTSIVNGWIIRYCKSGLVELCTVDKFKEKFEVMS